MNSFKSLVVVLATCSSGLLFLSPSVFKQLLILPPMWLLFPTYLLDACPVLILFIFCLVVSFSLGYKKVTRGLDVASLVSICVHILFLLDLESTPKIPLGHGANLRCKRGIPSTMCFPNLGIGSVHMFGLISVGLFANQMDTHKLCLTLDGASITVYALLVASGVSVPPDPSFLIVRLGVVGFQLLIDIVTAASSGFHAITQQLTGLLVGAIYVLMFLPSLGDFSVPPYVRPCDSNSGCFPLGISVTVTRWTCIMAVTFVFLRNRFQTRKSEIDFANGYKTLRSVLSTPETTDAEDDSPMSAQNVL
jgi:hypothetical protein